MFLRFLFETLKRFRGPRLTGARSGVGGLDDLVAFLDDRPQPRRLLLEFRGPRLTGARSGVGSLDDLVAFLDDRPQPRRLLLEFGKFGGNRGDILEGFL